jgi:hypothetical protein
MRKLVLLLILAAAVPCASAQAYKWKDAAGRVQYSDAPPPPGAKEVQQLRKTPPAASGNSSTDTKSFAEQDADFRKRLVEQQEAQAKQAKAAEDEQVRSRNCTQAKGQLAALDAGSRMVQRNAQGERIALDDAERARARQDTLKAIESWCK